MIYLRFYAKADKWYGLSLIFCLLMSLLTGFMTGCSTSPKDIRPSYVSSTHYYHYNCEQLSMELERIKEKITELSGEQKGESIKDKIAVGGSLIFWPALFLTIGHDHKKELAQLKGEYDSIKEIQIFKKCSVCKQ